MTGEKGDDAEKHGFLARWSRRKRAGAPIARKEVTDEVKDDDPLPEADPASQPGMSVDDERHSTPDDPDALTAGEIEALPAVGDVTDPADLKIFLRKGVPAALRKAAMRRMWSLNPKISAYLDPARDYAYDWNVPGGVPGSGGALSPEAVAKMLSRVIGSRPAEAQAGTGLEDDLASTPADPAAAQTVDEVTDISGNSKEEPNRQSVVLRGGEEEGFRSGKPPMRPDSGETLVEDAEIEGDGRMAADMSPAGRKRHGGAMPRKI